MDTLLIRYPDLFNGIPFYYDQNIQLNSNFIEHGKQLSFVLRKVRVGEFQYRWNVPNYIETHSFKSSAATQ